MVSRPVSRPVFIGLGLGLGLVPPGLGLGLGLVPPVSVSVLASGLSLARSIQCFYSARLLDSSR